MKEMSTKTRLAIVIIALVVVVFLILQIHSRLAGTPVGNANGGSGGAGSGQNQNQNPYPVLNTASTTSVTLKLGEHITVGLVILTPTEVLQDSRCATGLQCVQAGTVVLAVNASSDAGADVIDLPLGKAVVQDGLTTTLTAVTPTPSEGQQINPADYSFTLAIEPIINGGNVLNP